MNTDNTGDIITISQLNHILYFITKSLYSFHYLSNQREDFRVLMPEWIITMLINNNNSILNDFRNTSKELTNNKIFGVEVYPHYKNEIVVYNINFFFNSKLDPPKIYIIEINRSN